jgi:hypothetical protein
MGALALSTSLSSGSKNPPSSYFEEAPLIINPVNRLMLGADLVIGSQTTDPLQIANGSGCYVFRVPDKVTALRVKTWGGKGAPSNADNAIVAVGGFMQGDIRVVPGEILFCIVGLDGQKYPYQYDINQVVKNVPALGGPGVPGYALASVGTVQGGVGGGFSAIFRLTQDLIDRYLIRAPADGRSGRYPYPDNAEAIINAAMPLLVAAGGGSGGYRSSSSTIALPGGRAGYTEGEDANAVYLTPPAKGGTQTEGGAPSGVGGGATSFDAVSPIQSGAKWRGGCITQNGPIGCGGGGYYGGGAGRYSAGSSTWYGPGGGGSNFMDRRLVFNPVAPPTGLPATADADAPMGRTTSDYTARGRIIFLWDTPA